MVHTSDFGSRGRGFEPHSGRRLMSLSQKCLPPPPQALVIPGKRWLRPNMTEKLPVYRDVMHQTNQSKTSLYMAFNNIAVCILIDSTLLVYFHFRLQN